MRDVTRGGLLELALAFSLLVMAYVLPEGLAPGLLLLASPVLIVAAFALAMILARPGPEPERPTNRPLLAGGLIVLYAVLALSSVRDHFTNPAVLSAFIVLLSATVGQGRPRFSAYGVVASTAAAAAVVLAAPAAWVALASGVAFAVGGALALLRRPSA